MKDLRKTLEGKTKDELIDMVLEFNKEDWLIVTLPDGSSKWARVDNLMEIPRNDRT